MNRKEIISRINKVLSDNPMNGKPLNGYQLQKLGIMNSSTFSTIMQGKAKPSAATLSKFAQYFNTSVEWILTGDENTSNKSIETCVTMPADYWNVIRHLTDSLNARDKEIERLHKYIDWLQNGAIIGAPEHDNE